MLCMARGKYRRALLAEPLVIIYNLRRQFRRGGGEGGPGCDGLEG